MAAATRESPPETWTPRATDEAPYRFSLEQVDRMLRAGILVEGDPIVLIDGLLVTKMTRGDGHLYATKQLQELLRAITPAGWHVAKEDPIALPDGPVGAPSLPEPDLAILRGTIADYRARKPLPADLGLVVEVADTTLAKDRRLLRNYAWSSIPVAWIVDLNRRAVEEYRDPTGPDDDPRYATARTFAEADAIPVLLDGIAVGRIAVRDFLP